MGKTLTFRFQNCCKLSPPYPCSLRSGRGGCGSSEAEAVCKALPMAQLLADVLPPFAVLRAAAHEYTVAASQPGLTGQLFLNCCL